MKKILETQSDILDILAIIESLALKQACLCAGTLRNRIWDLQAGYELEIIQDVDVIFFDPSMPYEANARIEAWLCEHHPAYDWEVKNQVYMHTHHPDNKPYTSVEDAIAHFPERCTAIGAYLKAGKIYTIEPYGIADILNFVIQPTPSYATPANNPIYRARVQNKAWHHRWTQLRIT